MKFYRPAWISKVFKKRLLKAQDGLCPWCKEKLTVKKSTLDHILPIHHGGLTCPQNLQLLHSQCNVEKGHKLIARFIQPLTLEPPICNTVAAERIRKKIG